MNDSAGLVRTAPSPGTAAVLEILPGLLITTFGIGHIYAGHVGRGLAIMFGWWIVQAINVALCFVLIGLVTMPLTWIAMLIVSPYVAAKSARAY